MKSKATGHIDMAKSKTQTHTRHRRGRPPRAPELIRRKRVVTLLTDSEFEELVKLANEEETSVSAFVHQLIARHLKRRR